MDPNEVGLTAGGFYAHFPSKRTLFDESLSIALESGKTAQVVSAAKSGAVNESEQLILMIKGYLSRQHRDQIAEGCPLPALTPDVARGGDATRENYEQQLRLYVKRLEALLPEDSANRHDTALALMAECVGGLMLARAVKDKTLSDRILKACRQGALKIAED
jgi:TetR/AcrR family transcriptional repressor of nem operon